MAFGETGEYILHCVERDIIKITGTIKCLPDQPNWNAENIEAARVSPFDLHRSDETGVILQGRPAREGDTDQPKKKHTGRQIEIKCEDLRAFG